MTYFFSIFTKSKKTHNHSTMIVMLKDISAIAKSILSIPISSYIVTSGHMDNEKVKVNYLTPK